MNTMTPLSVLDLAPIVQGGDAAQSFRNSLDLARHAERLGYHRFWLAEHHGMPGIASAATSVLIAHIAGGTQTNRVGAGGIMLPNHSPLVIAEQFGTLEALFPGRIDLGLGRAPGTDRLTALALRRSMEPFNGDDMALLLQEMLAYSGEAEFEPRHPFEKIRASPEDVALPPIWILGSSDYGARLAAAIGRGYAFAYHFSPHAALPAMRQYREGFQPSSHLDKPHAILAVAVVCAETQQRAEELARTHDLLWVSIRKGDTRGRLPSPQEAEAYPYTSMDLEQIRASRSMLVVGTPERVHSRLTELAEEMGADELMITSHIHDHAARLRSYQLLAEAFSLPKS